MKIHPGVVTGMVALAPLAISSVYPIAQYLAVNESGTGFVLRNLLFIEPVSYAAFLLLVVIFAVSTKGTLRAKGIFLLFVAVLTAALWPIRTLIGNRVRRSGFVSLAQRSKPLVSAIEAYRVDAKRYPAELGDLVPTFIPEVPKTGMAAYQHYFYETDENRQCYSLIVPAPNAGINADEFRYSSNAKYPDYGKRWEQIADWKYYHE